MRAPLTVYLTFDVEVWCNGWLDLDAKFPESFDRYVYGRSRHGEYALPKTLEILANHGLRGVFFVEPLFSARFGQAFLDTIVDLIRQHGQEVQLHLHPEWTDEIHPPLIENVAAKRQHLSYYSRDEQIALIGHGIRMLKRAGCEDVSAFRAGSFAANRDTYAALAQLGIRDDSSVDVCMPISCADMEDRSVLHRPFARDGVNVHPLSVFRDGYGYLRHAQVGACSFQELRQGLRAAHDVGFAEFVILSHNFELLKPGTALPDRVVVTRFMRLCEFLAKERERFRTAGFAEHVEHVFSEHSDAMPKVGAWATGVRYVEQAWRRL
jgi:peptidoglycan/xylan/chitin deacetylase (PgdA/CDA1 family)